MKAVSFYHKLTGALLPHHCNFSEDAAVALNTPPDHVAIEGHHDHLSKRVDVETREVVDHQPPQPALDHVWDDATKRWKRHPDVQAVLDAKVYAQTRIDFLERHKQPRAIRDFLLRNDGTELLKIDQEIESLRSKL